MGLIERAAASVSKALKGMWDELLNVGRPDAPNDMLRKMQDELSEKQKSLLPERQRMGYGYSYDTSSSDQEYDARRKAQLAAIDALKSQIAPLQQAAQLQNDISASIKQGADVDNKRTDALIYQNRILEQSMTWQEKRSRALSELWKNVAASPDDWNAAQRQQAVDAINKQFHPDKSSKTPAVKVSAGERTLDNYNAETLALQAQLKTLQEHRDINDVISQQRKQQWELISKFSILEEASKTRALTKDEQSLLATKDRALAQAEVNAGLGDQIAIQERLNRLQDSSQKYVTQMAEKTAALSDSAGLSSRQAQRLREEAQLRQGWLNGGGKLEDAGYEKELAALKNYYAEEDKLRGDWKAGAVAGWNEYLDAATNTYDAVKNVANSTLTGLSDMLTSLMTTGKASVKEFGKSMLKMIVEVTNRLMVAYAVQAAMGWISGGSSGGSTPSGAYTNAAAGVTFNAKGGVYDSPGLSKYVNGVYDTPQYFTFQGASKFAKGGVFAEAGEEAIMPLTRDSAGRLGVRADGTGGATPQINVDIYVDNKGNTTSNTTGNGDAAARALAERMKQYVQEGIIRAIRDDGAIGGRFVKK
ncbi:phage tail tape measure protein [Salmonella enterica subsp. enterica serovar Ank]|nr:phage tail tape measure protein [Salmonella enterica subsp. enterica serovar Ank]